MEMKNKQTGCEIRVLMPDLPFTSGRFPECEWKFCSVDLTVLFVSMEILINMMSLWQQTQRLVLMDESNCAAFQSASSLETPLQMLPSSTLSSTCDCDHRAETDPHSVNAEGKTPGHEDQTQE